MKKRTQMTRPRGLFEDMLDKHLDGHGGLVFLLQCDDYEPATQVFAPTFPGRMHTQMTALFSGLATVPPCGTCGKQLRLTDFQ